ncbi:uncharacterized protein LOC123227771 [Mangifera indica]|uniref:uncharacterized protein LOC123227771 n=1 Tax=Mangifera indica TaxID=29780 RepID=UPI001CF997DC|nr:uncharacterized protein LOC123227771 [Mangifera indica]
MAPSHLNLKSHFHARSNSLPSRSHPLVSQIDELLCRLRATEVTSSSTSNCVNGLTDLYDLVNNFLLLPLTQQVLAQECNGRQVDELLDESLKLMDVCSTTRDALLQIKEDAQQLESILRRRRTNESVVSNQVGQYFSLRKNANKVIRKSLKYSKSSSTVLDNETAATISLLREVEGVTFRVFELLFSYISGHLKPTGWSLISKLMHSKRLLLEENATECNEFEQVDAELYNLLGHKTRKCSSNGAENAVNVLGKLESSIQDLEEGMENLLRRLIKARVTLLNIINH